jgi:hypothetical protein
MLVQQTPVPRNMLSSVALMLGRFIEDCTAYKPLLASIRAEFDRYIAALRVRCPHAQRPSPTLSICFM